MPITDNELVEGMACEMFSAEFERDIYLWQQEPQDGQTLYLNQARAALAYVRPIIEREARAKALDEAAGLASFWADPSVPSRILALKDTPHD